MKKEATVVKTAYRKYDSIEVSGSFRNIQKYLKVGYTIKESADGCFHLTRVPKLFVTLEVDGKRVKFNLLREICAYYGIEKFSSEQYKIFLNDIEQGKIKFTMDPDKYWCEFE